MEESLKASLTRYYETPSEENLNDIARFLLQKLRQIVRAYRHLWPPGCDEQEVVSTVAVNALRAIERRRFDLSKSQSGEAWLARICVNHLTDENRKFQSRCRRGVKGISLEQFKPDYIDGVISHGAYEPSGYTIGDTVFEDPSEAAKLTIEAMRLLTPKQRDVLRALLKNPRGLDAAKEVGMTFANYRFHLCEARKRIVAYVTEIVAIRAEEQALSN